MCQFPILFGNDSFMDTIVQHIFFLLHNPVFISCSGNFLILSAAKCQLSTVDRIIQNTFDEWSCKSIQRIILSLFLFISMLVQPWCNCTHSHIGMDKFIIDQPDYLCLIFCNLKFSIHQFITIWGKSTVPFSFSCFLFPSFHRLHQNILTFNFCHSWQNGNHQFSTVFRTVNAILYTDQIYSKILHPLQWIQNVRSITPKSWQLKYQYKLYIICTTFNIVQHPLKFRSAFYTFAGFSFIRKFLYNLHVLILCIFSQFISLSIQTVTIHLHGGGDSYIYITSNFLIFH